METCAESPVLKAAEAAKLASGTLAAMSAKQKSEALLSIADALDANAEKIEAENKKDLEAAKLEVEKGQLNDALYQRLKLDKAKLQSCTAGIRQIAAMADPVGHQTLARELDEGLYLYRKTCPIGVVAVIFESRPEAMPQILSLCLKTGNAVILKGGAEAEKSNRILFDTMQAAAARAGVPADAFALISTRADVKQILSAEAFVDLIIPRGSNDLVRYIQSNTRIHVLGHADGICHIYVDEEADLDKAIPIIVDSKVQYPSACNSTETLLIHQSVISSLLPKLCASLQKANVELRLDSICLNKLNELKADSSNSDSLKGIKFDLLKESTEEDWHLEYCDLILSIKSVGSMDEAIAHINKYGSGHTEAMISKNKNRFKEFFQKVNSAGVFFNSSTRFADGFRYGFGAEVGISTAKMHPRGPVGVEGLVTYKYELIGNGHIVGDYSGPTARQFTHKDID